MQNPSRTLLVCLTFASWIPSSRLNAADVFYYSNPVRAGDYPDPAVIRVDKDYWATATSSEWGPQFPLLHSRDLVNWEVVGTVFDQPPDWAVANFWAPEIMAWKNRYYVYYTARKRGGPLAVAVATADKPQGPYTDHGPIIAQAPGSIDGVAFDDEKGRRYLVWKEDGNSRRLPTILWAAPLNDDGTRLTSEPKELIRNDAPWEGAVVEGPFLVRRGEWFYLFYSGGGCCGASCSYALGVARSKTLLGPWEKNPANPILAGNESWRCPGHGSIVQDELDRYWLLYHAYKADDFVFAGRQMLLDEIEWQELGWPTINAGNGASERYPSPLGVPEKNAELNFETAFNEAKLGMGWNWPLAKKPVIKLESGFLSLSGAPGQTNDWLSAVLGRSITVGDFSAVAVVELGSVGPEEAVGLAGVGDLANATGIAVLHTNVVVWHRAKGKHEVLARGTIPAAEKVKLRVTATGGRDYHFSFSTDGERWVNLGPEASGKHLPPWDRAVRVALTVGGTATAEGKFDSLLISPAP